MLVMISRITMFARIISGAAISCSEWGGWKQPSSFGHSSGEQKLAMPRKPIYDLGNLRAKRGANLKILCVFYVELNALYYFHCV